MFGNFVSPVFNADGSLDLHVDANIVALAQSALASFVGQGGQGGQPTCPRAGDVSTVTAPDGTQMEAKFDPWHPSDQGLGAWIPMGADYHCPPGDVLMREDPPRGVDVVERA